MTRIIDSCDLAGLIPPLVAVDAVRKAFENLTAAPALGSVHTRLFDHEHRATFHPGGSPAHHSAGLFAHYERLNYGKTAQSYTAVGRRFYAMYDTTTAELAAIILGSLPLFPFDPPDAFATETAITSAVGTGLLARPDSHTLAIIGTGRQARRHLFITALQFPLHEVRVFSRNENNVAEFIDSMAPIVDAALIPARSAKEAVTAADIVICATASNIPVIDGAALRAGSHVTSIVNGNRLPAENGANPRYRRELDDTSLARADIICAVMRAQAIKDDQGDLAEPVAKGIINWDDIKDLSEILVHPETGRSSPDQITLFKQNSDQGVGFMALARLAFETAKSNGIGIDL